MFYFKNKDTFLISNSNKEFIVELIDGIVERIEESEKALKLVIYGEEVRIVEYGPIYKIFDKKFDCILETDFEKFKLKNKLIEFNELKNIKPITNKEIKKFESIDSEGPKLVRTSENSTYKFKSPNSR